MCWASRGLFSDSRRATATQSISETCFWELPSGTSERSRWWLLLGPEPEQDFNIQLQPLGVKSGKQTPGPGFGDVIFG